METFEKYYAPIARITRGDKTESVHFGAIAVCDTQGHLVWSYGDAHYPCFIRSSAKPFQAIAALTTGLQSSLQLSEEHLAIMCSSHGAEAMHLKLVNEILTRAEANEDQFTLGPHEPLSSQAAWELCSHGQRPSKIHNNCSGKHAGMMAACRVMNWPVATYFEAGHPLQQRIHAVMAAYSGLAPEQLSWAIDGCGVPSFYLSPVAAATAFARLGKAAPGLDSFEPYRRQIVRAMVDHPELIAKSDSFSVDVVRAARGGFVGKSGAEGIFCFALANQGLGCVIKIADGNARAIPLLINALVRRFDQPIAKAHTLFSRETLPIRNSKQEQVGEIVALI